MVAHTFNPRTRETGAEGSLLVQGHPRLQEIESVRKRNSSHKGDPSTWDPMSFSTREVETGVIKLGRDKISVQSKDCSCSLRRQFEHRKTL